MGTSTYVGGGEHGREFMATHWTLILDAAGQVGSKDSEAWQEFCVAYWSPLYAYIRRQGYSHEDAEDRTQELFAYLVSKNALKGVKPGEGKFRSWLLTVCNNFLKNQYRYNQAQKRGGGQKLIPIDDTTELNYKGELVESMTPEDLYEKQWAIMILQRVLTHLQAEYEAKGREKLYASLKDRLPGGADPMPYAEVTAQSGVQEAKLRAEVNRLRRRYGTLLRKEIAATVSSPAEVDDELRYLLSILARK